MMSDIGDDDMLKFDTEIGEVSVSRFNRNPTSMVISKNKHQISSNPTTLDFQHGARKALCHRALSPLSLRSNVGPHRYRSGGSGSHRSIVEGRPRSPNSLYSVGSNISLMDITNTLKFENFNTSELKRLKDIICRKLKLKLRRRHERNRSLLLNKIKSASIRNITRKIESDCDSCESPISSNDDETLASVREYKILKRPDISKEAECSLMSSTIKRNNLLLTHKPNYDVPQVMKPDSTQVSNEVPILKDVFTNEYKFPLQRFNKTAMIPDKSNINNISGDEEIFENTTQQHSNFSKNAEVASPKILEANGKDTFKMPFLPEAKKNERDIVISRSIQKVNTINHNNNSEDLQTMEPTKASDVSKKCMKRKLFTQKVDVFNSKALDECARSSPQTKVNNKEKNKVRRLVSTQSCLYRNVSEEEESVLDLIHKIVPADQIDATTSKVNKIKPTCQEEITSDISDTFTDETLNGTRVKCNSEKNYNNTLPNCKVVLHSISNPFQRTQCVKSFWDTDIESEMEIENIPVWKINKDTPECVSSLTPNTQHVNNKMSSNYNNKLALTEQNLIINKKHYTRNNDKGLKIDSIVEKENNLNKLANSNTITQKTDSKTNKENNNKVDKTHRDRKGTLADSISIKKIKSRRLNNNTHENQKKTIQIKRNRSCTACETVLKNTKKCENVYNIKKSKEIGQVTKYNEKARKIKCILDSSLDTSKDFEKNKIINPSKTSNLNSKARKVECKYSNDTKTPKHTQEVGGVLTKNTRAAKCILSSSLDSSESFSISYRTRSKQRNMIEETSKAINMSDSFNISNRTRSKDQKSIMETSKENLSQLSDSTYNISLHSLRQRKK